MDIFFCQGKNRLHLRAAFLGLFFACGETEPSSLPALDGMVGVAEDGDMGVLLNA